MSTVAIGGAASDPSHSVSQRLLDRAALVALVAGYYAAFLWAYDALLVPWQGFWGFARTDIGLEYWLANWLMVLVPALWMPLTLRRGSQLLFMFQYLVLFVPATVVLYGSGLPRLDPADALQCLVVMFIGLQIMQLIYLLPVAELPRVLVSRAVFWTVFVGATLLLLGLLVYYLGGNLQFIGLAAIYSVRLDAAAALQEQGATVVAYAASWLASVFLPVLFAVSIYRRSWILGATILGIYIFMFGVTGTKTALLAVPILAAAAVVAKSPGVWFSRSFVIGITLLLLFPVVFDAFGEIGREIQRWYVLFVHARIFGVPQLIMAQYLGFFAQHPETAWSQVTGIGAFVVDPYDMDLPRTIGYYYYGTPVGLNGGLWVQDGIAAAGLPGVMLMSLIAAAVLWLFDAMSARVSAKFVFITSAVVAISFTNIPLPTTLVSGGLALLMIVLHVAPPVAEKRDGAPAPPS